MNELEFINLAKRSLSAVSPCGDGIGDDCAVMPAGDGRVTVVTTDMLAEGVHFRLSTAPAYTVGWKALAVNLSDVASMGVRPVASFMAIARPDGLSDRWYEEFLNGYRALSERFGVPLMGGDTTASESGLTVCVTAIGEGEVSHVKRRSAALPGDIIMTSGTLGDSAAGLSLAESGSARYPELLRAHLSLVPQVSEGEWLGGRCQVHAMTDISDGIAKDLEQICSMSDTGARVELTRLPISDSLRGYCSEEETDPVVPAVCGGEDFKLLFTVDEAGADTLVSDFEARFGYAPRPIGCIVAGSGVEWLRDGASVNEKFQGYIHR